MASCGQRAGIGPGHQPPVLQRRGLESSGRRCPPGHGHPPGPRSWLRTPGVFLVLRTRLPFSLSSNVWLRPSALASLSASSKGCFPGFSLLPPAGLRDDGAGGPGKPPIPFLESQRQSRTSSHFSLEDLVSCLQKKRRSPSSGGPWTPLRQDPGSVAQDTPALTGAHNLGVGRTVLCMTGEDSVGEPSEGGVRRREGAEPSRGGETAAAPHLGGPRLSCHPAPAVGHLHRHRWESRAFCPR